MVGAAAAAAAAAGKAFLGGAYLGGASCFGAGGGCWWGSGAGEERLDQGLGLLKLRLEVMDQLGGVPYLVGHYGYG